MADLPRLERAQRRIPQGGELSAIGATSQAFRPGSVLRGNGLVAAAPQLDARGFIDESRGLAIAGQGVADVGGAVQELAWEQAKAVAERQVNDFEGTLAGVQTETGMRLAQEPDEMQWTTILDEQVEKARGILSESNMMPAAKDAAEGYLSKWERQQRYQVGTSQAKQSFANAGRSIAEKAQRLENDGDFAGAEKVWASPEAEKYHTGLVAAQQLGRLKDAKAAHEERGLFDSEFGKLTADPGGWKKANAEPWKGKEAAWQKLRNHADAREREQAAGAVDEAQNLIASGSITVPEEIDALRLPGLTDVLRSKLRDDLANFDQRASETEKATNGKSNWLKLWKEARAWKGGSTDAAAVEYYDLMKQVRFGVPDDQQGKISELLYRKMGVNAKPPTPSSETEKAADTILDTYWNEGTFNGGRPMTRMNPQTGYMEDDPAAVRAAAGVDGAVRQKVREYLETHPNTKPEEVQDIIRQALPDGTRGALLRKMQGALNFGGVMVPKSGEIGEARLTVFGGKADPDDNGLSAFGGPTGPGGREGVAVPEKILRHVYGGTKADWENAKVEVTFPGGGSEILPIADLGTAEWVWEKNGAPVMDLTPGAVEQLGGAVMYGKNGTLKGVRGLKGLSFRLLPLSESSAPPFNE